jgi:hypothetical protein
LSRRELTLTATVSAFETDLAPEDNTIVMPISVFGQSELSLDQRATPQAVLGDSQSPSNSTVENADRSSATGVVITNWLVTGLEVRTRARPGMVVTNEDRLEVHLGTLAVHGQAMAA